MGACTFLACCAAVVVSSRGLFPSLSFFCAVLGCLRNLFFLLRVGVPSKVSFSFGISYLLPATSHFFSVH
ncbi:hypothetical protein CPAR01_16416 [Colletotrichum paranaense]|uniref:Secreted peptide n=1 Tax=Colletotrichum paranaense TaxID=1914294 RepID=A0ABQ9RWJ5_9PEZI|nr:uncharacterized protein CPAR01_16416 [Colletotrichum paranaense]KAK1516097.1 hypothetical protein CPAR01_16416 [Colletotrichum paranaense]